MYRAFTEILSDIGALWWAAMQTEKGIELMDELATVLGLPDIFPNVDGLEADDAAIPANPEIPEWLSAMYKVQGKADPFSTFDPPTEPLKTRSNRRGAGKQTEVK